MKKKIIIFGVGGTCLDILNILLEYKKLIDNSIEFLGFLDDDEKKLNFNFYGYEVIGKMEDAKKFINNDSVFFINGIGSAKSYKLREKVIEKLDIPLDRYFSIIHPKAFVSSFSKIGNGSVIFANCTIGVNVKIGNHVLILPNSTINHDSVIGDYSIITSQVSISGNVKLGKSCYIGTSTSIRENIVINDYSLIGMGSNVVTDIEQDSVYYGNPAKKIRKN